MDKMTKAIQHARSCIIEAQDWMLILLGYKCCLEGTIKFNKDNKWYGSRLEDDVVTIYYHRSGDEVVKCDVKKIRDNIKEVSKLTW